MARKSTPAKQAPVVKLIRKSNDLVEARYKFDIWETRVFTKMLTMIRPDDADFKEYRIYLKDIIKEYGLEKDKAAYRWLKSGALKLGDKTVRILRDTEEGQKEFRTKIIAGTESFVNDNEGKYIDVSFHPRMKPYLLALKSRYTVYDAQNVLKLPSTYSIRIYELLKQYEKIGKRKFDLQELKEIVGALEIVEVKGKRVENDSYPLYGNFRQKVLLKAQRDLKKYTDICFEFDPIKRGRAVREILFYIESNVPERVWKQKQQAQEEPEVFDGVGEEDILVEEEDLVTLFYEQVKEWVKKSVVEQWVKSYPKEQIQTGITYTLNQIENGSTIANVGGYLQTMVRTENLVDPFEQQKEQVAKQKQREKEREELKKKLDAEIKRLYQEVTERENEIIREIFKKEPSVREEIFNQVKNKRHSGYDASLTDSENMKNPMFLASFRNAVKKLYTQRFDSLEPYHKQIKILRQKHSNVR